MNFTMPEAPVMLEQRNIRVICDKKDLGSGTLYVNERIMSWDGPNVGFTTNFQDISLHGISNDPTVCDKQCVLVLLNAQMDFSSENERGDNGDARDDEYDSESNSDEHVTQLLYIPEDPSQVTSIYEIIRTCQSLNPDPEDVEDIEEDDDEIYVDADEDLEQDLGAGGDTDMVNLANHLHAAVDINYATQNNGDHVNDDIYEDAD